MQSGTNDRSTSEEFQTDFSSSGTAAILFHPNTSGNMISGPSDHLKLKSVRRFGDKNAFEKPAGEFERVFTLFSSLVDLLSVCRSLDKLSK